MLCVLPPVCSAVEAAPSPAPQKMQWEDPSYAKDVSATQADSRAEERAKDGWTEFIRHHEDRKKWVTEKRVDILMIGDSIVFGWSREGHKVWDEHYGERNANKGKVALMRGPVVYCLEGVDNKDVDLFKLSLPTSSELKTEHRATLLGGVTVIHPQGLDGNKTPVKLTAIPWYAWANREKGPMTIWINESSEAK